jgi:hypothetical protein
MLTVTSIGAGHNLPAREQLFMGGVLPSYLINRYSITFKSSRPSTDLNPDSATTGIYLFNDQDYLGYAYFYPDGTPLRPPVILQSPGPFIALSYNLSQLDAILTTLREEQPIYLFEFGSEFAGLSVGVEPTGEEEGLGG